MRDGTNGASRTADVRHTSSFRSVRGRNQSVANAFAVRTSVTAAHGAKAMFIGRLEHVLMIYGGIVWKSASIFFGYVQGV